MIKKRKMIFSSDEHQALIKDLKDSLPKIEEEINDKIKSIISMVEQINSYDLMNFLTSQNIFQSIFSDKNTGSEHDIPFEIAIIDRVIEYLHSLIISLPDNNQKSFDEAIAHHILKEATDLYKLTNINYLFSKNATDTNMEKFRLATFYNVRGIFYQFFVKDYYNILLKSQNELLKKSFNLTTEDIIMGLNTININHSFCLQDAIKKIEIGFEKHEKGINMEELLEDNDLKAAFNNLLTLEKYNIKKITNWPDKFLNKLSMKPGECNTFLVDPYSGWINQALPIFKYPLLNFNNGYYYFNYYNFFDCFYRCTQKAIIRENNNYAEEWNQNQKNGTENNIIKHFIDKFNFQEYYMNNFYYDKKNRLENDGFVIFEDKIIIFEIKAASLSPESPLYDFGSYKNNFEDIYNSGIDQSIRLASKIISDKETKIYDENRNLKISLSQTTKENIIIFIVCVDDLNEITASYEKSDFASFDNSFKPIVISLGDFLVYCDYFDTRIELFHFLSYRRNSLTNEKIKVYDELDHLGLYLAYNNYPLWVATNKSFKNKGMIYWDGYRVDIDYYYAEKFAMTEVKKPKQDIPDEIWQIITSLEKNKFQIINSVNAGISILELSNDFKKQIGEYIKQQINHNKNGKRTKIMFSQGEHANFSIACIFNDNSNKDVILNHIKATMVGAKEHQRNVFLLYFNKEYEISKTDYLSLSLDDVSTQQKEELMYLYESINEKRKHIPKRTKLNKIGRNELCSCGSGKKYKYCCMLKNQ